MESHTDVSAIDVAARDLLPEVVALRRELHRHPEMGLDLPETRRRVLDAIDGLGLRVRTGRGLSSVTAVLDGAGPGPTLILRADMDALAVQEDTGLDFASRVPGVMHACGHDLHTAMLVGAARLLAVRRHELTGRVLFMFQPGEEGFHGSARMLDEGLLDDVPDPERCAAFALHVMTGHPSGTLHVRPGPMMAAQDGLRVVVRGRGGHGARPHRALDPVPVACAIVQGFQTLVTRRVDVFDPAVVTVGRISAGTMSNVIPEAALLEGTVRTLSEETRQTVRDAVVRMARGIAEAHGAQADVEIVPGYPVTVNDPGFTGLVTSAARSVLGAGRVAVLRDPEMTAEDFSYLLRRVPGTMAFLGACPPGVDVSRAAANHSGRAVFDEDAMAVGMAAHAAVALRYLRPETRPADSRADCPAADYREADGAAADTARAPEAGDTPLPDAARVAVEARTEVEGCGDAPATAGPDDVA